MGSFFSTVIGAVRGRMMTWRSDRGPQELPVSVVHRHEDDEIGCAVCGASGPSVLTMSVLNRENLKGTEEAPFAPAGTSMMPQVISRWKRNFTQKFGLNCENKVLMKLETELKEKAVFIDQLNRSQRAKDADMHALKLDLDRTLRHSREAAEVSAKEVQRLKSNIEERDKALENAKLETSQWKTKCQKLEAQLALIEQKSAQESLTSGSYPDDHANPGMMEAACKVVDKATEELARFLHKISVTKSFPLNSVELEQFLRQISLARPAEFSRAIQVRYVWSHWICFHMFQGFEHAFFDADGGQLTALLDSKKHALECFRNFQQKQSMSSSDFYNEGGLFQAFCTWKYRNVFSPWLVKYAFYSSSADNILFDEYGRFGGDGEIFARFMDVARAIWLVHELAFSFDPPATILRMTRGTPYDKQFHEPVIHGEDSDGMSQAVVLMIRPAFRIRNSTIRSRVFLSKNP